MKFKASVDVMPHRELLDPQGKTVVKNMHNLNIDGVDSVRIGKHIDMDCEADHEAAAQSMIETAGEKPLVNVIMETDCFELEQLN